jgi:hypothetical protein
MRLIYAVTASDLQNSGHPYGSIWQAWRRIGKLPLFIYLSNNGTGTGSAGGLDIYGYYTYISLPVGRAMAYMKPEEVITGGYYLVGQNGGALANNANSALRLASSVGEESLFTHADIYAFTGGGSAFIEYAVSYDLKTATLYVNGRFVKTVQTTLNHDRNSLVLYIWTAPSVATWYTLRDIYAAFYDPSKEKPYLGRWACEALSVTASDFPNSLVEDTTTDTVGLTPKTIEFTYSGTRTLNSVAVTSNCVSSFSEALDTTFNSGVNSGTITITPSTPAEATESWITKGAGPATSLGSVNFDNVSKKVTASLKLKP